MDDDTEPHGASARFAQRMSDVRSTTTLPDSGGGRDRPPPPPAALHPHALAHTHPPPHPGLLGAPHPGGSPRR